MERLVQSLNLAAVSIISTTTTKVFLVEADALLHQLKNDVGQLLCKLCFLEDALHKEELVSCQLFVLRLHSNELLALLLDKVRAEHLADEVDVAPLQKEDAKKLAYCFLALVGQD